MQAGQTSPDQQTASQGGVGLVDLLTLMCFVLPTAGAMGFSSAGHCRKKGILLALLIGIPMGFLFAYALRKGCGLLANRFPDTESRLLTVIYLLAMLCWLSISGWFGGMAEEAFFPKQAAYLRACRATQTCLTSQAKQDLENLH